MPIKYLETAEEFNEALQNAEDQLVMVDFFATWCGPCKAIAPKLESLNDQLPEVIFYKVDVAVNEATTSKYSIKAMPTFLFFKGGERVAEVVGANLGKINDVIAKYN